MKRTDPYGHHLQKGEYYRKCDGRYEYRYKDVLNKQVVFYAPTLALLREREEEFFNDIYSGVDAIKKYTFTLNQLIKQYLNTKTSLKDKTLNNYFSTYNCHIKNTIGRFKMSNLSYPLIFNFYVALVEKNDIGISTLQNVNSILHGALDFAVQNNILQKNISNGAYKAICEKYNYSRNRKEGLSIPEHKAFLICLENTTYPWRLLFTFLLHTGCRIGEAIGLCWENINFDKNTISITHTMIYTKSKVTKKHSFHITTPKTRAGNRVIPMTKLRSELLKAEYQRQVDTGFSSINIDGYERFVLLNTHKRPHNPTTANKKLKKMIKAFNNLETTAAAIEKRDPILLPHISNHVLRHTFCSRLCENEINVKVIQDIMGHSDFQTTMNIYATIDADIKREHFNVLDSNNVFTP